MEKIIKYFKLFREDISGTFFFIFTLIRRDLYSFIYSPVNLLLILNSATL